MGLVTKGVRRTWTCKRRVSCEGIDSRNQHSIGVNKLPDIQAIATRVTIVCRNAEIL